MVCSVLKRDGQIFGFIIIYPLFGLELFEYFISTVANTIYRVL